jgi:hypothetical protein
VEEGNRGILAPEAMFLGTILSVAYLFLGFLYNERMEAGYGGTFL